MTGIDSLYSMLCTGDRNLARVLRLVRCTSVERRLCRPLQLQYSLGVIIQDVDSFLSEFRAEMASAILRTDDEAWARRAMQAAVRGGFRVIEFTLTTPGALKLVREFSEQDDVIVGAGTVLSPEDAGAAVQAGASFLVSPVVDDNVISAARALGVAMMPGVHTPSEMYRAHQAGAPLQKLFPAPAGGPSYVRSVLGPLPFLNIVPTNGVDHNNFGEWLEAGVFAAGFVSSLFAPEMMAKRDESAIERRATQIIAAVQSFKARQ